VLSAPVNLPGPNCGGRFNNKEKLDQKLVEQIRNRSCRGIEKCIAHGARFQFDVEVTLADA